MIAGSGLAGLGSPAGAAPAADHPVVTRVQGGLAPQCDDGKDNDGNGVADYPLDLGCSSANDKVEKAPVTCETVKGVHGNSRANVLKGTAKADKIFGEDGNDTITGLAGSDCLYGGDDRDGISGGTGADLVSAGTGEDTVHGNVGNDVLYGGADDDTVYGDDGNDLINGGGGTDHLYGGAGNDRIVAAGTGRDVVDCGPGTDVAIVDRFDEVTGCETKVVLPPEPAPDPAALSTTPGSVTFAETTAGETTATQTVTVRNTGDLASGVPTVALGGSGAGQFALSDSTCTATLPGNGTCTVKVAFAPTSAGSKSASVTATASPGGQASTTLSGTAVAAPTQASLSLDASTLSFGPTTVGDTTETQTVTVTNDGELASGVPTVALASTNADQYALSNNTCTAALDGGDSCTVDIAFAPTATGSKPGTVTATATPGGTASVTLSGSGETAPALSISASTYDYGYSDDPAEHTFTITNTGTVTTGLPTASLSGDAAFEITSDTCDDPVVGGGTCTVKVTYTGSGSTAQSATLSVASTPGGTVTADLAGFPVALSVSPASKSFGGVLVGGASDDESFVLTNHRSTSVQVDGEGVTGPFPLSTSCFSVVISAGGTCTFSAAFHPITTGATSGTIDYFANGGHAQVDVSGTGQAPAALSATGGSFGAWATGDTGSTDVTITNTGDASTGTVGFSVTGDDAADFSVQGTTCPTVLSGGSSCTATVAFAPEVNGDKTATLHVTGTDAGATASLSGLGAPAGVTLYPNPYDYGYVPVGGAAYKTFRVVNTTGNGEDMNSASSGPPFPLELNQDFTCVLVISTIPGHGWCTMTISMKPQSQGPFSTTLTAGGTNFNTSTQMYGTGYYAAASMVPGQGGKQSPQQADPKSWVLAIKDGKPVTG